jgi:hypothetical protein
MHVVAPWSGAMLGNGQRLQRAVPTGLLTSLYEPAAQSEQLLRALDLPPRAVLVLPRAVLAVPV